MESPNPANRGRVGVHFCRKVRALAALSTGTETCAAHNSCTARMLLLVVVDGIHVVSRQLSCT